MSLETAPIDCSNETDLLTFHDACAEGNTDVIVNYLAYQGFDMYIGDNLQRTGFHLACIYGHLNVVQLFLQREFDMYVGDKANRTGFHWACINDNLNVVEFLLQQKFDMYVRDKVGRTGFHGACYMGNLNVVQFLFGRGFNMNISNNNGMTGFHLACIGGKLNAFMIELGFSVPNVRESNESTRFPSVCRDGNLNVVQFLLQKGFDMNLGDSNNGLTGFHAACVGGNLKVVHFLVQQGFDINTGDNSGGTGFIWACFAGNLNIIWFLLHQEFKHINDFSFQKTGLEVLIDKRCDYSNDELYMPCVLLLIEAGGKVSEEHVIFEELIISAIQHRIIEITFMKKAIDKKWTGRIAQLITDFTMEPFTDISLQNLSNFFDDKHQPTTKTICSLF